MDLLDLYDDTGLCDLGSDIDTEAAERAWLEDYKQLSYSFPYHVTGSTVIVGSGKDYDVVILDDGGRGLQMQLALLGYQRCCDAQYIGDFTALRKGDVNAIVVTSEDVYKSWEFATLVCSGIGSLPNFGSILAEKASRCYVFGWLRELYRSHG